MADVGALFVLARPPRAFVDHVLSAFAEAGRELRASLFDPANWHQSLSNPHLPTHREPMRRAFGCVRAPSVPLRFDFDGGDCKQARIDWTLRATPRRSPALDELLHAMQTSLAACGIADSTGHTAHITLRYAAPQVFRAPIHLPSLSWTIDAIELVEVAHHPYRYVTLARRTLDPPRQAALF